MSLRQKLDDSPVLTYLTALVVGFVTGVGTYEATLRTTDRTTVSRSDFAKIAEIETAKLGHEQIERSLRLKLADAEMALERLERSNAQGESALLTCKSAAREATDPSSASELVRCRAELDASKAQHAIVATRALGDRPSEKLEDRGGTRPSGESAGIDIEWSATAKPWCNNVGQRFTFRCPANGVISDVRGHDEYMCRSSICTAAVHAGRINARDGGVITVRMLGVTGKTWRSVARNGVQPDRGIFVQGRNTDPVFVVE